jgi:hypothetical protein
MTVTYDWRGAFDNVELNELLAEAFETRVFDETDGTGSIKSTGTAWGGSSLGTGTA